MSAALTLYQVEDDLQALLDTEALVPAEQLAEFEAEFSDAVKRSKDKREAVAHALFFCDRFEENCDKELQRIAQAKEKSRRMRERIEQLVVGVIESLGPDARGRTRN